MRRDNWLYAAIICFFLCAAIFAAYLTGDAMSLQQSEMQDEYAEQYNAIHWSK